MKQKPTSNKIVRKSAKEIPAASRADLDRLRTAMNGSIDTSDIPERRKFDRIKRDANGRLPPRPSMIRDALVRQMQHLQLSVHRLWQMTRARYPTLSQSAIDEFLKGQRQLELPSVEALLTVMNLRVVRKNGARRGQSGRPANEKAKKISS